jgi:hypothetical protein
MSLSEENFPAKFLSQFMEAMKHVDKIEDASTWKKDKWDTPPLCKVRDDYEVDEKTFKDFEKILYFLTLAVFGTGSEGRSRGRFVDFYLKDKTKDYAALPMWRITRPDKVENSLRKLLRARDLADGNAKMAQSVVEDFDRYIKYALDCDYGNLLPEVEECVHCGWKRDSGI